jgi:hypothetical protein
LPPEQPISKSDKTVSASIFFIIDKDIR